MDAILQHRQQQVLYDKKWKKFLRRAWVFRCVPFADFVLAAGSLATGEILPDSDFDVIVASRRGRIFTARLFSILFFGFFNWRRTRLSHREAAKDKVCLNHFITEASYRLKPPYTNSWCELYKNLVPVFGDVAAMNKFWDANADWMGRKKIAEDDLRFISSEPNLIGKTLRRILSGKMGDWFEGAVKRYQIRRIEKSLRSDPVGYKPRITYSDEELEFHPDRRKFEE